MNLAGKFIVIDGLDGSGKGAQLDRLDSWTTSQGAKVRRARDPGGTQIGDRIRHVLLGGDDLSRMAPRCETLLFMASRAQLVGEVIRPALDAGQTVLCDRFISATCAYQVAAGFPREDLLQLGRLAVGDTWPHVTIVLDVPPEIGFARIGRTPQKVASKPSAAAEQHTMFDGAEIDAMERRPLDYHRKVRALFNELPAHYPTPVVVIDATRAVDAVFADIQQAVERAFS
jgi:dTMP kinase